MSMATRSIRRGGIAAAILGAVAIGGLGLPSSAMAETLPGTSIDFGDGTLMWGSPNVPVTFTCTAGHEAAVEFHATQGGFASGGSYKKVTCTGEAQTETMSVRPISRKDFVRGVAWGEAKITTVGGSAGTSKEFQIN